MINRNKKGFTLIEVMIVVAIVAILVALAVPSFRDVIRKSRRSDAMNAIINIQLAEERWRVNNSTYTTDLENDFGMTVDGNGKVDSPDGHYKLSASGATFSNYTILAEATGDQVNDSCENFTLTNTEGNVVKSASGSAGDDRCWTK